MILAVAAAATVALTAAAQERPAADAPDDAPTLLLAHYMPWYVADEANGRWGWHWTMNHFDPSRLENGRRQIASRFYPAIGPYDSADPNVLEYHLLLMKLSGIDGVIVDWYGTSEFRDYAVLHRNTRALFDRVARLGMRFVICYEDQTIPALIDGGRIEPDGAVAQAARDIAWAADHWFGSEAYVRIDGRPVLLSFGWMGLTDTQWEECLAAVGRPISYFSETDRRSAAIGAFDWPAPDVGLAGVRRFQERSRQWPRAIPVAFPRFVDIYAEAGVHASWGRIADDEGRTFERSLRSALESGRPIVQIATWNDWGEGTQVEPSVEFRDRDLRVIQRLRREITDRAFAFGPDHLRLPERLLRLRRRSAPPVPPGELDEVVRLIVAGEVESAAALLDRLDRSR